TGAGHRPDGADVRSLERVLRLDEFPGDAGPRALALAGLEMLAALSPAVRERIQFPQPPTAARVAIDTGGRRAWVGLSAVRRDFFDAGGFGGWGGRLDVNRRIGERWLLVGDVEVAGGGTAVTLGEANALLVSLGGFWGVRAAGPGMAGA